MAFKIEKIGTDNSFLYMIEILPGKVEKSINLEVNGICSADGELVSIELLDLPANILKQMLQLSKYHKQVEAIADVAVNIRLSPKFATAKTLACSLKFDLDYRGNLLFIEIM